MKWWIECRREGRSAGQVSILREVGAPGSGQVMATTTNNPSTRQTPRHPARIFKCKSGKKGAGEIERIKVPPDKEAQTRPWCRPSRKINYRSTLIVEVTAAQPGQ